MYSLSSALFIVFALSANVVLTVDVPCSTSQGLSERIANAYPSNGEVTAHLNTLRGTIDNVLTQTEIDFLLHSIPQSKFIPGSGYNDGQYGDKSESFSMHESNLAGLELKQLASPEVGFDTEEKYTKYLEIREKVRLLTEKELRLCPGTLQIDFTHFVQKTLGGNHQPHSDNCFYYHDEESHGMAKCDETRIHPFPHRDAASIVYINGPESFGGGEFFWADTGTGQPSKLVTPQAGRMAFFTAGPENLHGALPVTRIGTSNDNSTTCDLNADGTCIALSTDAPRRVYLSIWYSTGRNGVPKEVVPKYNFASSSSADENDPSRPDIVLELPVRSMKKGGLKLALSFFLLALQNEPARGTWKFVQEEEAPLGMVFKDQSAMFSIQLKDASETGSTSITIERHMDVAMRRPSLQYQLQESVTLHSVLDEFEKLSLLEKDDEGRQILDDDRLLTLLDRDAISIARKALPARPAR